MKSIRSHYAVLVLALQLVVLPVAVHAQFNYVIKNGTVTITGYTGPGGDVAIPATIDGLPVTGIGYAAFIYRTNFTRVTIPASINTIGEWAFFQCEGMTSITIPGSVRSIGQGAFEECIGLNDITISDGVTSFGDWAFAYCESLTRITIPGSVTAMGQHAFANCTRLNTITVSDGVTSIGTWAFANCYRVTSVTIPDSVTSIGDGAFFFCSSLPGIGIGNGVTSIGGDAFSRCSNLTSVTIPNSVTSIGKWAFNDCARLTQITIGSGVTSIADYVFYGCINLTGVYFLGNAPSLGFEVFHGVNNAIVYYLPGTTGWGTTFGGLPAVMLPAPEVICSVQQPVLWSPNKKLVNVGLLVTALDDASTPLPATVQVFCNQNVGGAVSMGADTLQLRADRAGNANDGRVYLILAEAADSFGSVGFASCTVVVPHDASSRSVRAVNALAADAKAYCDSHDGAPPLGYFLIGNGSK